MTMQNLGIFPPFADVAFEDATIFCTISGAQRLSGLQSCQASLGAPHLYQHLLEHNRLSNLLRTHTRANRFSRAVGIKGVHDDIWLVSFMDL